MSVTLISGDTLTQGWGGGRAVIRGLSRDVRVTLTSWDTLTQGWGRAVVRVTLTSGCLTRQSEYLWTP